VSTAAAGLHADSERRPLRRQPVKWLGHALGAALVAATILNGLGPFAKRVGLIERDAYQLYWRQRCGSAGVRAVWLGLGRMCVAPEAWSPPAPRQRSLAAYVFAVERYEWPLKLSKDLVLAGLVAFGLWSSLTDKSSPVTWRHVLLPAALLAYVLGWAIVDLAKGESGLALIGVRIFAFLAVTVLWRASLSAQALDTIASGCAALLFFQSALVPWEMLDGITDRPTRWFPHRVAGTLVHSNTLGVLAVTALGFGLSFSRSRRSKALLWLTALVLVVSAGSGVGWVVLSVLAVVHATGHMRLTRSTRFLGALLAALLCLCSISFLTGRPDVLHSVVAGRFVSLHRVLQQGGLAPLVGGGVGRGTNSAATALATRGFPQDSTVTSLIEQVGIVGLVLFYAILVQAWSRARAAGVFLVSVLIASLGANVLEAFPVNALLGLGLAVAMNPARSLGHADP
jgi:hypothetical protein